MDESLIEAWVADGTISKKQATKMLADIHAKKADTNSNRIIVAVSTIGAILIGIAAISFIALNWNEIPSLLKVAILLLSTAAALYSGYTLGYEKQNLPRVGQSLLFLGALLWGATVFLTAQIYNVNANAHWLILVWFLGTLPLAYVLASRALGVLLASQFYAWFATFIFSGVDTWNVPWSYIPLLCLTTAIAITAIGGFHYRNERLAPLGRVYRVLSLIVAFFFLFFFTFTEFNKSIAYQSLDSHATGLGTGFMLMAALAFILVVIQWFLNPGKLETAKVESPTMIAVLGLTLLVFFIPPTGGYTTAINPLPALYTVLANLLFVACCALMLYLGYTRQDIALVNLGIVWSAIYIIARYCNVFWNMLNPWVFFLIGGAVLLVGGIALEKQRRAWRATFTK